MKIHISGSILSMINVSFENSVVEGLKQSICRCDEDVIDQALDIYVDSIYDCYALTNKDDGLNFEEWSKWFTSLDGVNEMLMATS